MNGTGAIFTAGPTAVVQTGRVVGGRIEALVANADVGTSVDDGGPFRRFVPDGTGGKDSGVLAEVLVQVSTGPPTWTEKYRNATTNMPVDDTIIASTAATATSEPGNFAIVSEGGALIRDNKNPWRLAEKPECSGGPLDLSASGEIDTYAEDPDGPEGHLAKDDPTPDGIAIRVRRGPQAGQSGRCQWEAIPVGGIRRRRQVQGVAVGTRVFVRVRESEDDGDRRHRRPAHVRTEPRRRDEVVGVDHGNLLATGVRCREPRQVG